MARRKSPRYAPESLERRLNPSPVIPAEVSAIRRKEPVPSTPGTPTPTPPASPTLPPGDGTPPISGPSVPGGTTEPARHQTR